MKRRKLGFFPSPPPPFRRDIDLQYNSDFEFSIFETSLVVCVRVTCVRACVYVFTELKLLNC